MKEDFFLRRLTMLDTGSLLVIIITFVLFALSLLVKGATHEILLEAGVFLVSVKLIIMSYKGNVVTKSMESKLNAIHDAVIKDCEKDNQETGKYNGV